MSLTALIERMEDYEVERFAKKVIKRKKAVFDRLARM